MYQFQKIVPASHQTNMLGLKITDKTYVYLAAAQVIFDKKEKKKGRLLNRTLVIFI